MREFKFFDGDEGPYFTGRNLVPLATALTAALEFVGGGLSRDVRCDDV